MTAFAWTVAAAWGLVLLGSAKGFLRRLPTPTLYVPRYGLWLPDGGEVPTLEPAPEMVVRGAFAPPDEAPERWLVLGTGVEVGADLPGRLAACGVDFVSVFPRVHGGPLGMAIERLRRDFAGAENVTDVLNPAGFADARCAWLRRADLALPGEGHEPVLRAARARKAHGLHVDLRDGRGVGVDAPVVRAPAYDAATYRAGFDDLVHGDPIVRKLLLAVPPILCLTPFLLLASDAARGPALLAIGLGSAARLMTAIRDGFGGALAVLGWGLEPALTGIGASAPKTRQRPAFPELPSTRPPTLTAARAVEGGAWLDNAAVPFLARRLGGSAVVMERIYGNVPAGRTALGRVIDRAVHISPGTRAVRHRALLVAECASALAPRTLLSVPSGTAPDAAIIGAPETTLLDPDPEARRLAQLACPEATVLDGTLERAPAGPFDVILYVGLSEYLADNEVVAHLEHLRARLPPDGALVTATTVEHPDRARMASWLGWSTRVRTPDALTALLDAAGYHVESRRADPLGIQWVLVARPRPLA